MLLVAASVVDRLVGCWLERDCLPVGRRSRPHTLLTSATEQQTIQQPPPPPPHSHGRLDRTPPYIPPTTPLKHTHTHTHTHTIHNVHAVFTENATFFYIPILTLFIFGSPFLRQMLCERHDVPAGPGSEMWIHLTMQFKEIHIKEHKKKEKEKRSSNINMVRCGCLTMPKMPLKT